MLFSLHVGADRTLVGFVCRRGDGAVARAVRTRCYACGHTIPWHLKPPITECDYPHKGERGLGVFHMDALNWLVEATSISGLAVYCAGMTVILGALAWANHLDRRQEIQQLR
jgi:hypothetical protein